MLQCNALVGRQLQRQASMRQGKHELPTKSSQTERPASGSPYIVQVYKFCCLTQSEFTRVGWHSLCVCQWERGRERATGWWMCSYEERFYLLRNVSIVICWSVLILCHHFKQLNVSPVRSQSLCRCEREIERERERRERKVSGGVTVCVFVNVHMQVWNVTFPSSYFSFTAGLIKAYFCSSKWHSKLDWVIVFYPAKGSGGQGSRFRATDRLDVRQYFHRPGFKVWLRSLTTEALWYGLWWHR